MKKYNTEIYTNRKADLEEIKGVLFGLRNEEDEHLWVSLFDTSKKNPNYVQAMLIDEDFVKEAAQYINQYFDIRNAGEVPYIFEARIYTGENFTHYRAFFPDASYIYEIFKQYLEDQAISTQNWLDVTEEEEFAEDEDDEDDEE